MRLAWLLALLLCITQVSAVPGGHVNPLRETPGIPNLSKEVSPGHGILAPAFPQVSALVEEDRSCFSEDEAPGLMLGTLSVLEDPDGGTYQYSILSGVPGVDYFRIGGTNGDQLYTNRQFNYDTEQSASVTVSVLDVGADLVTEQTFTFCILDANTDSPSDVQLLGGMVNESMPVGSHVGTITWLDDDTINDWTITLQGEDAQYFDIIPPATQEGRSAEIVTRVVLDYEKDQQKFALTININDGTHDTSQQFTIFLGNTNDEPPKKLSLTSTYIDEGKPAGSVVGSIGFIDEDFGTWDYTMSLCGPDADKFQIRHESVLCSSEIFEYVVGAKNEFDVTLKISDGTNSRSKAFVIKLVNLNLHAPENVRMHAPWVSEDVVPGSVVSVVTFDDQDGEGAIDPETGLVSTYSAHLSNYITGNTFHLDGFEVVLNSELDYETESWYEMHLMIDDGRYKTDYWQNITVLDVNDNPPYDIHMTAQNIIIGEEGKKEIQGDEVVSEIRFKDRDTVGTYSVSLLPGSSDDVYLTKLTDFRWEIRTARVINNKDRGKAIPFSIKVCDGNKRNQVGPRDFVLLVVKACTTGYDVDLNPGSISVEVVPKFGTVQLTNAVEVQNVSIQHDYKGPQVPPKVTRVVIRTIIIVDDSLLVDHSVIIEPETRPAVPTVPSSCSSSSSSSSFALGCRCGSEFVICINNTILIAGPKVSVTLIVDDEVVGNITQSASAAISSSTPVVVTDYSSDEPPHWLTLEADPVPENAGIDYLVGTFSFKDVDTSIEQLHAYVAAQAGDWNTNPFYLGPLAYNATEQLFSASLYASYSLDYEEAQSYDIQIEVVDDGCRAVFSASLEAFIEVLDVYDPIPDHLALVPNPVIPVSPACTRMDCSYPPSECYDTPGTCQVNNNTAHCVYPYTQPGLSCNLGHGYCDGEGLCFDKCLELDLVCDTPPNDCYNASSGYCFKGECRYSQLPENTTCGLAVDNHFCDERARCRAVPNATWTYSDSISSSSSSQNNVLQTNASTAAASTNASTAAASTGNTSSVSSPSSGVTIASGSGTTSSKASVSSTAQATTDACDLVSCDDGEFCEASDSGDSYTCTAWTFLPWDGGDFRLVRRVQPGSTWHPAEDDLAGTSVYGTYGDHACDATFSIAYSDESFDEFLFMTPGNDTDTWTNMRWIIVTKAMVDTLVNKASIFIQEGVVVSSFTSDGLAYEAGWYYRGVDYPQDPWLSYEDHDSFWSILYGEASHSSELWGNILDHNGANVYIR